MNFKKFVVNSLAVVGAIVVADKIVEAVTNKSTKVISKELLNRCCDCDDSSTDYENDDEETNTDEDSFPDTENDEDQSEENDNESKTYEFTVKAENITSEPSEV